MENRSKATSTSPLFIVGTGRCGSTIIYSVLAMHPEFSWMPSWVDGVGLPEIAFVNRFWALPGADRYRLRRRFPTPVEPYDRFKQWDPTFESEELTEREIASARRTIVPRIHRICRAHGTPRYLAKMVGRPVKVNLFAHLYPNAHFLHVSRELKPTVSSLLKVDFYKGWGAHLDDWRWETIPASWLEFWEETGRSEAVGVAIGLELNQRRLREQLGAIEPGRVLRSGYADFVRDPVSAVQAIGEHIDLEIEESFLERVRARHIYGGADAKWKQHLSPGTVDMIDSLEALIDAEAAPRS